jgi:hypothetical protein
VGDGCCAVGELAAYLDSLPADEELALCRRRWLQVAGEWLWMMQEIRVPLEKEVVS